MYSLYYHCCIRDCVLVHNCIWWWNVFTFSFLPYLWAFLDLFSCKFGHFCVSVCAPVYSGLHVRRRVLKCAFACNRVGRTLKSSCQLRFFSYWTELLWFASWFSFVFRLENDLSFFILIALVSYHLYDSIFHPFDLSITTTTTFHIPILFCFCVCSSYSGHLRESRQHQSGALSYFLDHSVTAAMAPQC